VRAAAAAVLVAAALAGPAPAQADGQVRTPSDPSYTLTLRSDASASTWTGREQVTFVNGGSTPLPLVYLRLWDNGITGCSPAGIRVANVRGGEPGPLSVSCSALPITLDTPVPPGGTGKVDFDVTVSVPRRNDRFGMIGREVLVGNAVPILAIHDGQGWHLEPYVAIGESFYSQVGSYRVTFDTPASVAIASTGVTSRTVRRGGRVVRTVRAPQVRDFAWVAGPLRQASRSGVHGTRVRVWHLSDVPSAAVRKTLRQSVDALSSFDRRFGRYPYGELDVVIGDFTGFGGMEYPNLVMSQTWDVAVAHEIAHQWWYGIVGDDEYADPWLDESFATYSETTQDDGVDALCARARWILPSDRITNDMGYWIEHPHDYSTSVYTNGACARVDLSKVLGQARFDRLLKDYVAGHRFGWSTTQDFKTAAQAVASTLSPAVDLTSFWAEHRIS
jgi:hypothetical protein